MSASAIYRCPIGHQTYQFRDLKDVMAKASPARSGDALAGLAAGSMAERVAAQTVLADVSLADFVAMPLIPYEQDEVTRLIVDSHDAVAFAPVAGSPTVIPFAITAPDSKLSPAVAGTPVAVPVRIAKNPGASGNTAVTFSNTPVAPTGTTTLTTVSDVASRYGSTGPVTRN